MITSKFFNTILVKDKTDLTYEEFYNKIIDNAKIKYIVVDDPKMDLLFEKLYNESTENYKKWISSFIRISYYSIKNNVDYTLEIMDLDETIKYDVFKQMIEIEKKTLSIINRTITEDLKGIVYETDINEIIEQRINNIINDLTSKNSVLLEKALNDFDKYIELVEPHESLNEYCAEKRKNIKIGLLNYVKNELKRHEAYKARLNENQYVYHHKQVLRREYLKRKKDRKED